MYPPQSNEAFSVTESRNLGAAHHRLMRELPANSPYREVVYPSIRAALQPLWSSLSAGPSWPAPQGAIGGDSHVHVSGNARECAESHGY